VIVASAHVGPVSVCGQIIAANGYDITLPIEKETGELGRSINRARTRMGLRFVETRLGARHPSGPQARRDPRRHG